MTQRVCLQVLRRAAEIAGDIRSLSGYLNEAEHSLSLWLGGQAIPERVFLKAVDLVLKDDMARAAQDRRKSPRSEAATQEQGSARMP